MTDPHPLDWELDCDFCKERLSYDEVADRLYCGNEDCIGCGG